MVIGLTAPTVQVCAFALGCAVIHAARAYAAAVTHVLTAIAAIMAAALSLFVSLNVAPEHEPPFDEMAVFADLSLHPVAAQQCVGEAPPPGGCGALPALPQSETQVASATKKRLP